MLKHYFFVVKRGFEAVELDGEYVTAKKFVRLYSSARKHMAGDTRSAGEAKSRCLVEAHTELREKYHKKK